VHSGLRCVLTNRHWSDDISDMHQGVTPFECRPGKGSNRPEDRRATVKMADYDMITVMERVCSARCGGVNDSDHLVTYTMERSP
jgi:hypothetical protein